ncbi:MAG: DNA repair protein RecN [Flavobacteriaceae bacterium]
MQEELEEEYEALNNVETLIEQLGKGQGLLINEPAGILSLLSDLKQAIGKIAPFGAKFERLDERVRSIFIEASDLSEELQNLHETVEPDPQQLELVNTKLQQLYDLRRKHGVESIEELIAIKENLEQKINVTEDLDAEILVRKQQLADYNTELLQKAALLSDRSKKILPQLTQRVEEALATLGMPNASFQISLTASTDFGNTGKDRLNFRFSANKGADYGELKKVASGGELSRIMLTIKAILAKYEQLPTMMFDEIDTGVSGEISNRMGEIMYQMSKHMQIFSITHLPQVASKGDHHFKVYKEDDENNTQTKIRALNENERVVELAEMLGGKSISDAALAHARELLN